MKMPICNKRRRWFHVGPILLAVVMSTQVARPADLESSFDRLYNFDFSGAHRAIDQQVALYPDDPTVYWVRASAYLFSELDRLHILESEFLRSDEKIGSSSKLTPDRDLKVRFEEALLACRSRAQTRLAVNARDANSLFSLAISEGLRSDYLSLVERRQRASLQPAKESQKYALLALQADPTFADAYLTTGITEYLVGSLPRVVRWFVRFDMIKGDKGTAVTSLTKVSKNGRYLGPFARILLCIIHLREGRPEQARDVLRNLSKQFPENPLFRRELARLSAT